MFLLDSHLLRFHPNVSLHQKGVTKLENFRGFSEKGRKDKQHLSLQDTQGSCSAGLYDSV